jgi:hypothetical protein
MFRDFLRQLNVMFELCLMVFGIMQLRIENDKILTLKLFVTYFAHIIDMLTFIGDAELYR